MLTFTGTTLGKLLLGVVYKGLDSTSVILFKKLNKLGFQDPQRHSKLILLILSKHYSEINVNMSSRILNNTWRSMLYTQHQHLILLLWPVSWKSKKYDCT
uniref:Uncharacterized protein n=1 Tax=Solanum lycopersicum TaxID=4081 RepID=A0A3Q7GHD0_SOLLC